MRFGMGVFCCDGGAGGLGPDIICCCCGVSEEADPRDGPEKDVPCMGIVPDSSFIDACRVSPRSCDVRSWFGDVTGLGPPPRAPSVFTAFWAGFAVAVQIGALIFLMFMYIPILPMISVNICLPFSSCGIWQSSPKT